MFKHLILLLLFPLILFSQENVKFSKTIVFAGVANLTPKAVIEIDVSDTVDSRFSAVTTISSIRRSSAIDRFIKSEPAITEPIRFRNLIK